MSEEIIIKNLVQQVEQLEKKLALLERENGEIKAQYDALISSRMIRHMWRIKKLIMPLVPLYLGVGKLRNRLKRRFQRKKAKSAKTHPDVLVPVAPKPSAETLKREYFGKGLDKVPDSFILYRIVGNDLTPRHRKGQAYTNLKFILENEPALVGCEKRWVVNRIVDRDQERSIIELLQKFERPFIHIPFEFDEYRKTEWSRDSFPSAAFLASDLYQTLDAEERMRAMVELYKRKNNYVMNNNGARNAALTEGQAHAKWILPWDGNCFITNDAWLEILGTIKKLPYFTYFVVPMARVKKNTDLLDRKFAPNPVEEPQLIFRKDSLERFNEDMYYGRRPKVELFWRLGVPGPWDRWLFDLWEKPRPAFSSDAGKFATAGWVARLSSGQPELEEDTTASRKKRGRVRNEAILAFLVDIDVQASRLGDAWEPTNVYDLERLARESKNSDSDLSSLVQRVFAESEAALLRGPYSVLDKNSVPPSGDKHDYWHPAPYWWPNPKKADGLPYIRKDGQRVPGTVLFDEDSENYDRSRLQRVFQDSTVLTLAWRLSNSPKFVGHCVHILKTFFVNPETRMSPHLKYAQVRMGHNNNQGTNFGIIEFKDIHFYLDAIRILDHYKQVHERVRAEFKNWLTEYLNWLLESPQGIQECKSANNHGTYYDLQVAAIADFLDEHRILYETLARAETRIGQQFAADGSQPEELSRATSQHYCCFNLQGWLYLAKIGQKWSCDLLNYKAPGGAGLRQALQWFLSYMDEEWPHAQAAPFDRDRFYPLLFSLPGEPEEHIRESIYRIKPLFHPDDSIVPFWNLGFSPLRKE